MLTRGKSSNETRSSNFSTKEMANPFSWGMIKPARKPPKRSISALLPKHRRLRTEDGMNANDIGKECGYEHQDKCESHHHGSRVSALQATATARSPAEGPSDRYKQKYNVADRGEQDPKSSKSARSIDKGDSKGQKDPTHDLKIREKRVALKHRVSTHIVTDASCENNCSNCVVQ